MKDTPGNIRPVRPNPDKPERTATKALRHEE